MINSPDLVFRNPLLVPAVLAWLAAQLIKTFLTLALSKKLDFGRLIGPGGMPSSHTSFVLALAISAGIRHGWDSALFAVSMGLSVIVMYDAAGVRRAAGRQAAILNRIVRTMNESGQSTERIEVLKELLGHKPVEVMAGALLGILVALIYAYRF